MFRRILGPTNRKVRVCVGLMLLALFCIQCAPDSSSVRNVAVATTVIETHEQALVHLRKLAQSDHVAALRFCLDNYRAKYGDFEANFIKQERIKGTVLPEQEMRVKFRQTPFSVAMKWTRNAPIGNIVLYVEGKYDNQMLVHPTNPLAAAVAPTVKRQPDGEEALNSTLRPVNQFGFERSIQSLIDVYVEAKKAGELREEVLQDCEVEGRRTLVLARYLPEGRNYPAAKTLIYIDQETFLPIMIEGFSAGGEFICRYLYKDLDFGVKFTDQDFLPEKNGLQPQR